ncbi:MAG: hypothetical protein ACTHNU_05820 [Gaiellales bacterium]
MRTPALLKTRRLAAPAAVAVLVATATVAGVAYAASGHSHPAKSPVPAAGNRASDATAHAARTALQRLVANGTIDQAQADAIERQVVAGSVDPAALVAAGRVNQTQMLAVAHALDQVKRSMAGSSGDRRAGHKVGAPGSGAHAPAAIVRAVHTALQRLVANGTIDQAQAATIEHLVATGSVDPGTLVANGTVTQAQMGAVQHALVQVKLAAAPGS